MKVKLFLIAYDLRFLNASLKAPMLPNCYLTYAYPNREIAMSTDPINDPDGETSTFGSGPSVKDLARSGISARIGGFEVDGDGRIRSREPGLPLNFRFDYRGILFDSVVEFEPQPRVRLSAELGKLPFSMQAGEGRRWSQRIVAATRALPHGRINVDELQDMRLQAECVPPSPLTPSSVMATVTAMLLDFKPYLALLGQALEFGLRRDRIAE